MRAVALSLVAFAMAAGVALVPTPARGAPVVKVRARTKIIMEPVRRHFNGVEVRGQVVDRFTGEAVPFVRVQVRMNDVARWTRSDDNGEFSATFDVGDGRYDIQVEYQGDEYYTRSSLQLGGVDVSKQSFDLTVHANDVAYSKRTVEVTVKAVNGLGGAAVTVELYAGSGEGELRHVGRVTTDDDGRGSVNLDREQFGAPGRKRVKVRFLGNRVFNPAEAQTTFLLTTSTETSLVVSDTEIAYESALVATGAVVDDKGGPVARAPVVLMSGARRIGRALTDAEGKYKLRAPGAAIGAGKFNVQAVYEPSEPWLKKSRSDLVKIDVAEAPPVPVTYTLAAFGATALAMIAFLGLRTKPWQAWMARLEKARDKPAARPEAGPGAFEPMHGLQPARPSLVSTLRRPHEFDFSGIIRDSTRHRPIAASQVVLVHDEHGEREASSDDNGRFVMSDLESGEWQARVSAHGYVTESFGVSIPHRGELRGAHIDLLPVRERVFSMYRGVARSLLPRPGLWGVWTPRQIFHHVRSLRPSPALSELTDFVEETYFSQRTSAESILEHARELVDRAGSEQTAM